MIQPGCSPRPERRSARAADGSSLVAQVMIAVLAMCVAAVGCRVSPQRQALRPGPQVDEAPEISSNILRRDYVGSTACAPCHEDIEQVWRKSPMHRMTRLPETAEVRAPFDGREFRFKDDVARFERSGNTRFMRLRSASGGERIYRVTKVIGGRYREDFAGVEVASSDPASPVIGDPHAELILPASYVFQTASFRLKGYSVMVGTRPGMRAGGVWNQTCIFCHNTIPYFDDLWGALHGPGAPTYQGEVVDRVLPVTRQVRYGVTDQAALIRELNQEVALLRSDTGAAGTGAAAVRASGTVRSAGDSPAGVEAARMALNAAMREARTRFGPQHFIEIGIGCEACHGGGREHVEHPSRHPTFQPRAPFLAVSAPVGSDAPISAVEWQNRACARCHQVLFSRYAQTWEGGSRRTPAQAGGSHISSGEARDFLLGGCARAMACTSCHDPHGEDSRERLQRLATPAGNGVCTGCHQALAAPNALRAHAHHDPVGAGGACVACHMPRKNMGLAYALTRYHRIGSPTDQMRIERDRPIECALCHADKTVGALLNDISRFWGKRYDTAAIVRLYGALDANVLIATIERGYAHEQATAMGAAGEQRFLPAAAAVARAIDDSGYPLVGYYGRAALAAIKGRPGIEIVDVPSDGAHSSGGHLPPRARATPEGDDQD